MSEGALEHLREALDQLHRAYSEGQLRILAGAGLSQTSDLPGWEALNRGLLARALLALHDVLAHQPDVLEDLAERLYQRVGRDAAAEFVLGAFRSTRGNSEDWFDQFAEALADTLYPVRATRHLAVRSIHRQLAALALYPPTDLSKAPTPLLHTTNYDPLLELALCAQQPPAPTGNNDAAPSDWQAFRWPSRSEDPTPDDSLPWVRHIHGWVDIDGVTSDKMVLTISDYLDLIDPPPVGDPTDGDPPDSGEDTDTGAYAEEANKVMERLFDLNEHSLLIMGMSLEDLNVRRFLRRHARRRTESPEGDAHRVYVIFEPSGDALLDKHLRELWAGWNVNLIRVPSFADLPRFIRDLHWGPTPRLPWLGHVVDHVHNRLRPEVLWSDAYQALASSVLERMSAYLRRYFAVPAREHLILTVFLPLDERSLPGCTAEDFIAKVATSRPAPVEERPPPPSPFHDSGARTGEAARAHALNRVLRVRGYSDDAGGGERTEGVAGHAFVRHTAVEVIDNGQGINLNFGDDMVREWDRERDATPRDWRSILALPVLDTHWWLPFAVITVTSNFCTPVWKRLSPERDLPDFKAYLRRTVHSLVAALPGEAEALAQALADTTPASGRDGDGASAG